MAENITTLLDKSDAENVSGSDYLYLVQGSGSDRDRKISLAALFASDPAHTLLVDSSDTRPKRYLSSAFAKSNEVTRLTPEGGQVYFIAKDVTRDRAEARALATSGRTNALWSSKVSSTARSRFILTDFEYWHNAWYMDFYPETGSAYGGLFNIRLVRDREGA